MKKSVAFAFGLLPLLLVLSTGSQGIAQITGANSDRHFIAGARAAALADTYVSEPYDVVSMYTNPATLASLAHRTAVFSFSLERILATDNIMNENLSVPVELQGNLQLGLGFTFSHVGHVRPESPLSGFAYKQYAFDAAIAWRIFRALSFGLGVRGIMGQSTGGTKYSFASSLGIYYFPTPEFGYGVSLQGVGDELGYDYDSSTRQTASTKRNRDRSVQIGVTWRYSGNSKRTLVTVNMANQKILGVKGLVYKGGIEGTPVPFLALRLGYWVGIETVAPKFGIGLLFSPLSIDYSVSPNRLEPVSHQFSISYNLSEL
jgi:hypothetical protein